MEDFSQPPSIKELLANPTPHHKGHPGIGAGVHVNSRLIQSVDLMQIFHQGFAGWDVSKNFVGVSSNAGATDLSALAESFQ